MTDVIYYYDCESKDGSISGMLLQNWDGEIEFAKTVWGEFEDTGYKGVRQMAILSREETVFNSFVEAVKYMESQTEENGGWIASIKHKF